MTISLKISDSHNQWLDRPGLQKLFDVIEAGGGVVRVNGGAVRNSLLGEETGDVDLSTTLLPQRVMEVLEQANIKVIATGVAHGTVTAIIDKNPYEITTLRRDIKTDGRHAVVEFGTDWLEDARRRDLTMNALYCDRSGNVFDPLGGYDDLISRNVRFIGEADARIREDYLRILRFFRFFAQYGHGRPDGAGLKACAREKEGLAQLSVERVWGELKKILKVNDPGRALLWMRTTGVLTSVLPESEKWGIDFVADAIGAEQDLSWSVDAIARLQIIVPPVPDQVEGMAKRLRLSKKEGARLADWAKSSLPDVNISSDGLNKMLYLGSQQGIIDRIRNEIIRQRHRAKESSDSLLIADTYSKLHKMALAWQRPVFPVRGRDLEKCGVSSGPELGKILARLENLWVESGFKLGKDALLTRIKA